MYCSRDSGENNNFIFCGVEDVKLIVLWGCLCCLYFPSLFSLLFYFMPSQKSLKFIEWIEETSARLIFSFPTTTRKKPNTFSFFIDIMLLFAGRHWRVYYEKCNILTVQEVVFFVCITNQVYFLLEILKRILTLMYLRC